ncbi:MAG TPA: hypothetical protein PK514_07790 [Spirochaetota bacterium]|nr:hypothetical protein [Spirochaetota bacterium]
MTRRIFFTLAAVMMLALYSGSGAAGAADRKQEIADRLFGIELMGGDSLGYSSEILDFLERVYGIKPSDYNKYALEYNDRRDFARENIDLYSIMSGGLAIRESLQLDTIRPADNGKRDVDPSKLKGPDVRSHPFNDMLKGREYKLFPLDKYAPHDFYYIHFSGLSKGLDFFDYIEEVGGAVHQRFTMRASDFMLKQKIMTQLALRENKEARAFYDSVIAEAAVTGSDPFIIEGSDVTLVFRLKVPALFNTTVAAYRRYFQETYRAEKKTVKIGGIDAEYIFTADRRINSVLLTLPDGTVIISNSVKAAEIVAATALGKRRCMADEADYRYMRTVYAASGESEDGFVYLSDAFIRRLVSPELRIKEARRMREAMRVTLLEKYVIYYTQLTGSYPATPDEVLSVMGDPPLSDSQKGLLQNIRKSRYHGAAMKLDAGRLADWDAFKSAITPEEEGTGGKPKKKKRGETPDDYIALLKKLYMDVKDEKPASPADVYSLIAGMEKPGSHMADRFTGLAVSKGSYAVTSAEYGRMGFMVPNIEKEFGLVTQGEAEEYRRFAEDYNEYWKEYFDPIGIRFRLKEGIVIETCILPLVNNSIYNSLLAFTGRGSAELHPDDITGADILSLCFKVNPEDEATGEFYRMFTGQKYRYTDLFGSEVQVHMGDSLPVTDFDGGFLLEEYMNHGFDRSDAFTGLLVWSVFHPVRAAVPVKKPEAALAMLDSFDPGALIGRSYLQTERYSLEYRGSTVRVLKLTFFYTMTFRIYYTVKDNMLHLATTENYIKAVLDSPKRDNTKTVKGSGVMVFRPAAMVLGRGPYSSGIIESGLETSRRNTGTMRLLSLIYPSANDRDLAGMAYRDFAFMPVCALGGEYTVDRRTGEVRNTVYGSGVNPVLKIEAGKNGMGDSLKRFFSTKQIRIELEFTNEGLMTRVVTE